MFKSFKNVGRTGTKIVILYLLYVCLLMAGVLFIVPFVPVLNKFYADRNIAEILGVMAGPGGLIAMINEIRKAIEKKKGNGEETKGEG